MKKTKFKDISYEKIKYHFDHPSKRAKRIWELELRNKEVILTGNTRIYYHINPPIKGYQTLNCKLAYACSICAEIGD